MERVETATAAVAMISVEVVLCELWKESVRVAACLQLARCALGATTLVARFG